MKLMKRLLPVLAAGMLAGPAMAAVDNSHHDMTAWVGATEVCLYCHGVRSTVTNSGNYGEVGELCVARCHSGAGFVAASVVPAIPAHVGADGATVAKTDDVRAVNVTDAINAHGLDKADLLSPLDTDGTVLEPFNAAGTALPYGGAALLECTSCHDVHNNTNTPFLQANLFRGGPSADRSFCENCHSLRGNNFGGGDGTNNAALAPNGEHPVNVALTFGDVIAANRATGTTNVRTGRYISFDGDVFDVTNVSGSALNPNTAHYNTGGHVGGGATAANDFTAFAAAGDSGKTFGCYTCHSPHVPVTTGVPHLLLAAPNETNGQFNVLCVGCHGDVAGFADDPNPGLAASLYFHPNGSAANAGVENTTSAAVNDYTYANSTGTFSFNVNLNNIMTLTGQSISPQSSGINVANGARPRCTSCHDAHGGLAGSMALVDIVGTRDGTAPVGSKICDSCHGPEGLPDQDDNRDVAASTSETANVHHRTSGWNLSAATVTDADGDTLNMNAPSWSGTTGADGLGCADCHVFSGGDHSTAHNW